ncbi:MAG TPA: UDP-N-acetylglucosamine 2-epimerase (non-hydrolyzing) [Saprospiraceae bacterium]|nr:UDP-N-acetylglucosamine 2-epimerase (non-hydrolyzing) [Saprospiraceae bacterium]
MNLDLVAGARPNFMKIGPIIKAIDAYNEKQGRQEIKYRLIHTGQHYDQNMSKSFFEQLDIPDPHVNLGAGSGTQATQTAHIMTGYEKALVEWMPDICIVVGDVNSTMACSIVAKKAGVKVAHVEAGIRSGDWTMPEEINRIVTDSITDYFFTTSEEANKNLAHEGHPEARIFFVGNTMIDSLLGHLDKMQKPDFYDTRLHGDNYLVLTLHRPSNVDDPEKLALILTTISNAAEGTSILFPVHPRTRKVMENIPQPFQNIILVEPLPYLEFIYVVSNSLGVITDSGGITEETSVMDIPCITLRTTTERPETIRLGTNELIPDIQDAPPYIHKMIHGEWKQAQLIPLWEGNAAERIVEKLVTLFKL